MLSRRLNTLLLLAVVAVVLFYSFKVTQNHVAGTGVTDWLQPSTPSSGSSQQGSLGGSTTPGSAQKPVKYEKPTDKHTILPHKGAHPGYLDIYSTSTKDRKFFNIKFGREEAMNPNIIPHPWLNDTWVMVAQRQRSHVPNSIWFAELVCDAQFSSDGWLRCIHEPYYLPLASTYSDKCVEDLSWFGLNVGPHDGRVFYGPEHAYVMYGSNSKYNCFGLWMQDMRMLNDWGYTMSDEEYFRLPTDLARPGKVGKVEKNWFMFWDSDDKMYVHVDTTPRRVFAEMHRNGSVGPDLGLTHADHDTKCLEKYLPPIPPTLESIHQATNSLSITLCKRADPSCKPTAENTFVMTLVHHKTFYEWHGEYEPYIYLFQRDAPFKMYGVTPKPLWINGREKIALEGQSGDYEHTQMFYVVSMSWKGGNQKYHGYMDDVMFLAFGIEDDRPAAIDVVAGDLLKDLGLCEGI